MEEEEKEDGSLPVAGWMQANIKEESVVFFSRCYDSCTPGL